MSLGELLRLAQLAFAVSGILAAIFGPLWIRRLAREAKDTKNEIGALRQLANAQLANNGGTTLIDKVDIMHEKLPSVEASLAAIAASIEAIDARQVERGEEWNERHNDNVTRLERLEQHSSETAKVLAHILTQQERMELRQEIGARVIAIMVPGLSSPVQDELRRLYDDPKVQQVIADLIHTRDAQRVEENQP